MSRQIEGLIFGNDNLLGELPFFLEAKELAANVERNVLLDELPFAGVARERLGGTISQSFALDSGLNTWGVEHLLKSWFRANPSICEPRPSLELYASILNLLHTKFVVDTPSMLSKMPFHQMLTELRNTMITPTPGSTYDTWLRTSDGERVMFLHSKNIHEFLDTAEESWDDRNGQIELITNDAVLLGTLLGLVDDGVYRSHTLFRRWRRIGIAIAVVFEALGLERSKVAVMRLWDAHGRRGEGEALATSECDTPRITEYQLSHYMGYHGFCPAGMY